MDSDLWIIRTSVSEVFGMASRAPISLFQSSNMISVYQPLSDPRNELPSFSSISLYPTHIYFLFILLQFLHKRNHDHSERLISILHRFFVFQEVCATFPRVCDPKRFLIKGVGSHFISGSSVVVRCGEI